MGDINNGSNWKFWHGRGPDEPCKSSAELTPAFREGRHYYLIQAVVNGLQDFECPEAFIDPAKQSAFERGFDWEIADCFNVVRSSM